MPDPVTKILTINTFFRLFFFLLGNRCRSCNTLLDFQFATGKLKNIKETGAASTPASISAALMAESEELIPGSRTYKKQSPPDVEQLGRSSWTLLHSVASRYPESNPTAAQKEDMKNFLKLFSHVYPCDWCAKDFEAYIRAHPPRVASREELGRWLCDAHNDVNVKLGKPKFNCNFWRKRWVDGWDNE